MLQRVIAIGVAVLLIAATASAEETADPNGKPKKFKIGKEPIYAVWYADGAWHVEATATRGQASKFQGSIKVDGGEFTEGNFDKLEIKTGKKLHDWVAVERDKKSLRFIFDNTGYSDGSDFKVSESTKTVTFGLLIGGKTPTENVLIGAGSVHPATNPFSMPAQPEPTTEKPAGKKKKAEKAND
jgi:hypothetical protein